MSVILILAAAMFSGMVTESEGPSGQFKKHTQNIDVGNLKEQYKDALNKENAFLNDVCVNAGGNWGGKDNQVCKCGKKIMDWKTHKCVNEKLQPNSR